MAKLVDSIEKMGQTVTESYKKIEDGVTGGYRKIETCAVKGFEAVADRCVDALFAREGETTADAKARLSGKNSSL